MSLNLNLNLKKPLVFLKVATTGFEPIDKKDKAGDRIIELSITKIDVDRTVRSATTLINPGIPIPQEASRISGIVDADVTNSRTFKDVASGLFSFIGDADFAGFNLTNFDLKFLIEEFNRAGIPFTIYGRKIIDLSSIFNIVEKRDFKTAASKFANQNLSNEPIKSEIANNISIHILNGMVAAYSNDDRFVNSNPDILDASFNKNKNYLDIHGKIILNKDNRPVFAFGKYEGLVVADMIVSDPGYFDWCVNASDLPRDTKLILNRIYKKTKNASQQNI